MAATILRRCCGLYQNIAGIKHLQLHSIAAISRSKTFDVIKNFERSAWFRSFFTSDNKTLENRINDSENMTPVSSKPKKPANVFLLFLQAIQEPIKDENPGIKRQDIVTEAARRWKELDPAEKSQWALERKEQYEKYKMERLHYIENLTPEQIKSEEMEKERKYLKKLKKARKHLGMPDRPWTSYKWFLSEKFAERSDEPVKTFFSQMRDKWNMLQEHEKEVYNQKQRESQEKYKSDMAIWEESMINSGRFDVIRKSTLYKLKQIEGIKRKTSKKNMVIEKTGGS